MRIFLGAIAAMSAVTAPFALAATAPSTPAAYVYVASNYSGNNNEVVAYAANSSGQLTKIPGSPFADNVTSLVSNGTYVFGSDNVPGDNGRNIYSYRLGSNGSLQYVGATNIQKNSSENSCNDGGSLLLDHTGAYLYQFVIEVDCNSESAFESFSINKSTGLLNYLGDTSPNVFTLGPPLTIASDNLYGYAAGGNGSYSALNGFKKQSNGSLVDLNQNYPFPSGQPANISDSYIEQAVADTNNHLAVNIYSVTNDGSPNVDQIATYSINTSTGNLTTSSTFANMPKAEVGESTSQAMSPSGKLLAVSGPNGVQIFNFNPSGQATATPTGLITRTPTDQIYWDNTNHLYAISNVDGTIQVFTVTATSAVQVSGSPYFVAHPVSLLVLPK